MVSKGLLHKAIEEFFENESLTNRQIRYKQYDICEWNNNGGLDSTASIDIPTVKDWSENPPEKDSKRRGLMNSLIADDDVPLIESPSGAGRWFGNVTKEIYVKMIRSGNNKIPNSIESFNSLYSDRITSYFLVPIVGLSFDKDVGLNEKFEIRPITNSEKELIFNTRDMGGGSVSVRTAILTGELTHAAVYRMSISTKNEWNGGLSILSRKGQEAKDSINDLNTCLHLLASSDFQMGTKHMFDETFYPTIFSSHEGSQLTNRHSMMEPETVSDIEGVINYFGLISRIDTDEGLRVAIDRLESSFKKVSNADGVVDAIIGIEALLSAGSSGSFQAVRRKASVLAENKATYSELGRLQGLRNSTVHGENTPVDRSDLNQARDLLSILIKRVIELTTESDVSRVDIIERLDTAIEQVIRDQFKEMVSEFEHK